MELKCLASGSSGNCYSLIDKQGNMRLLDAGISIKDIKIGIDFKVSNLKGALISHAHQDHSYALKDLERMGINVIAPFKKKPNQAACMGGFFVQYFPLTDKDGHFTHTNGDGSECPIYGYLIGHDLEPIKLLYITDTNVIKWRFKDVTDILLGIDYTDKYLENEENEAKKRHILSGHLELKTAVEFVKTCDRDKTLKNIVVCHLSDSNSDVHTFENEIHKVTDSNINFAKKGEIYQL